MTLSRVFAGVVLLVTACGGDDGGGGGSDGGTDGQYTVGGTIVGNNLAVRLSLNGMEETFSGPSFVFDRALEDGEFYAVQFVSTPDDQVCQIRNAGGVATSDVVNVEVVCSAPVTTLHYADGAIHGHIAIGDYDGDGALDIAINMRTNSEHAVGSNTEITRFAFGAADGTFTRLEDVIRIGEADSSRRGHVSVSANLNGDAMDDYAIAGGSIHAYGGNSESPTPLFTSPEYGGSPLRALDVDNDGFDDLITIITGGSIQDLFSLYRNNGDGTFGAVESIGSRLDAEAQTLGIGVPIHFAMGDFVGDTKADLLTIVNFETGIGLAVFPGNGNGTFGYPTLVQRLPDDLFSGGNAFDLENKDIAFGDFDGDGDNDIAITSTTNVLHVMLNQGDGTFVAGQRVLVGTSSIHVHAADFDNDGILDLASLNNGSKEVTISLGAGDGTFGDSTGSDESWVRVALDNNIDAVDMVVVDLDADGYQDIIIGERRTERPDNTGHGSIRMILAPAR